jgi:aquaporin Z
MRRLAAEFVGTFVLVFAGTGAIVINDASNGNVSHVGIALTFGLVVLAMIYAVGDVSGAHLNPAVTLGFFAARRFDARWVTPYIAFQRAGAILASLVLRMIFPSHATLGATLPVGAAVQSFVLEIILTFVLMFVILSVSTGPKEKGMMAGIAVGAVIGLEALSLAHLPVWQPAVACRKRAVAAAWSNRSRHDDHNPEAHYLRLRRELQPQPDGRGVRSHLCHDQIEAVSAGSRPSGQVNPKAVEAMKEIGYDLTTHRSKSLEEFDGKDFDTAVTMGCSDACPLVRAKRRVEWQIPDPKQLPAEQFRDVRNLIKQKVVELLRSLETSS